MIPWYRRLFQKDTKRFAEVLLQAQKSKIGYRMRWAKKLMRITDKMQLNTSEQCQIFDIGIVYYQESEELNFQLPHLPEIKKQEIDVLRMKRNLAWREILGNRFDNFKDHYDR